MRPQSKKKTERTPVKKSYKATFGYVYTFIGRPFKWLNIVKGAREGKDSQTYTDVCGKGLFTLHYKAMEQTGPTQRSKHRHKSGLGDFVN